VPVTPDEDAEMVTVPPFLPCAIPELRTEARFGLEDFQLTPVRLVPVLPSLKVPVAVNLIEVPFEILGLDGVMLMETNCTVETVSPVEPVIVPKAAFIVVLPLATLEASPVALIVAAAGVEDVQTTDAVMSCVLLSLKVPVAVNCFVVSMAMVELAGVTTKETKVAAVTVSDAVPLTEPEVAVIVVVPVPTLVAKPVGSTVATDVEDEDQANEVSSCVLPSSKLPTALNCWTVPAAIDCVEGLTEIETNCAGTTVSVEVSLRPPTVAVIVVEPAAIVVTSPEPLTLATEAVDELQVTPVLRSELDPSL